MPRSPDHKTSGAAWDGQLAHTLSFGRITFNASAAVLGNEQICPCDGEIVQVLVNLTAAGDDADSLVNLLKNGSAIIEDWLINGLTTGVKDITHLLSATAVNKGDIIAPQIEQTGAGSLITTVVIMPRGA